MTGSGSGQRRWRLVRASQDAVPASVRRVFMAARRRGRRLPGLRRHRRLWALVAVGTGLAVLAGWLAWGTSVLGVREVRVTGTAILTPQQVREAAAIAEQTPLLRVRPDQVAERVAVLPPVASVRVHRDWPDTIRIEVVERTAVAAVPVLDGFALIDAEGVGFQTRPQAPAELPVVLVADPETGSGSGSRAGAGTGDPADAMAPDPESPAVQAALTVLAALTPRLRSELKQLTVAGPADLRLELQSERTVLWGDPNHSREKARVATVLLDREGEVIDVSARGVVSVR